MMLGLHVLKGWLHGAVFFHVIIDLLRAHSLHITCQITELLLKSSQCDREGVLHRVPPRLLISSSQHDATFSFES